MMAVSMGLGPIMPPVVPRQLPPEPNQKPADRRPA
jgi:hypothetical protein